jgi:hypothetical protein
MHFTIISQSLKATTCACLFVANGAMKDFGDGWPSDPQFSGSAPNHMAYVARENDAKSLFKFQFK